MNSLALVMIVRDEERSLARCLESARAWVDEIVVVDTGSSDATLEIARRLGARVASFAWCDDFSAARNAALALAEAPWRLVLDADEWIIAGADSLAALRGVAPDFIGQVSVASVFDGAEGGVGSAPSWLPRLLPRGVRYAGRVHEQPDSLLLPRRRLELVVAHDGYLDVHKAKKAGRNERLLTLALGEAPDDAYLHYQLGKDRELRSLFATALPHYERALAGADAAAAWRHDLVLRTLFTLKKLGCFDTALALAEAEMPRWQGSPDFFFTLGDLLLDFAVATPARAAELLPMIEASWLRALEIGEQPQLNDTVRGRGSFLAAHNLAVLYAGRGDAAKAAHWHERARSGSGPARAVASAAAD
jgi:glycosyltransferase involved in cell wall biosynthesis